MYQAVTDPYCYKGTTVLKNRLGIRDQDALDQVEADTTAQRFAEALPQGSLTPTHYCSVHRHLFGDIYAWAGRFRITRISKGDSTFCYPENIPAQMRALFGALKVENCFSGLDQKDFSTRSAHFLAELNAIHAFREGNGRTQLAFFTLLADRAGHPVRQATLQPEAILDAMIASFKGDEALLVGVIHALITPA